MSSDAPEIRKREIDWALYSRYGLMISLCELIPIPLLDSGVANYLRKRLVRAQGQAFGIEFTSRQLATLGPAAWGGCLGMVVSVLLWPFKKLFRSVFFFLMAKAMADTFSDVVHRALMVHEALERGWLPDHDERVREAMDIATDKIDIRVVERALLGKYRDARGELNTMIFEATRNLRAATAEARSEELASHIDKGEIPETGERLSRALLASLQGVGTAPEAIQWFVAEMELRAIADEETAEATAAELQEAEKQAGAIAAEAAATAEERALAELARLKDEAAAAKAAEAEEPAAEANSEATPPSPSSAEAGEESAEPSPAEAHEPDDERSADAAEEPDETSPAEEPEPRKSDA